MPPASLTSPPRQEDVDAALAAATSIVIEGEGAPRRLDAGARAALRSILRVEGAASTPPWSARRAAIVPARAGQPLGTLWVAGDLSVRWGDWSHAARLVEPRALGSLLADHGVEAPLRSYDRDRGPEAAAARALWERAAPAGISTTADPDRRQIEALLAQRGEAGAAWALCAWHGARAGSWDAAYAFESVSDAALRVFGVHEIIALAAGSVPPEARAGAARFLVDNVTSRGWNLPARLPLPVREALVEAARASAPENGERAARLLIDEGPLAPAGTALVAASASGALRRLCAGGARAFAADGYDLVRLEPGRGRTAITKLFKPETPIAARKGEVLFLQPNGVERVRADGDEVKAGRAPLFGLPARRLPGLIDAFVKRRDEALARVAPGADLWPLDPDPDACDAYAAFGGDLPAALRLEAAFACDPTRRVLIEVPRRGAPREVSLDGAPVIFTATEAGVLAVVDRGGAAAIVAVDAGGPPRDLGVAQIAAGAARGVMLVAGRAWLRLAAPLGDVLVAVDPPA